MSTPAPLHPTISAYYLRDRDGLVHLAEETVFGGLVAGCDEYGDTVDDTVDGTVVEAVPDLHLCAACLAYYTPREDTAP